MDAKKAHKLAVDFLESDPETITVQGLITKAAENGKFALSTKLDSDFTKLRDVCNLLTFKGFKAEVVPGNSGHTLYISW